MAFPVISKPPDLSQNAILEVQKLLWGEKVEEELFLRWSQGFIFSELEPTALLQYDGGPCAVIAPVQAYLIKSALFRPDSPLNAPSATPTQHGSPPPPGTVPGQQGAPVVSTEGPRPSPGETTPNADSTAGPTPCQGLKRLKECTKEHSKLLLCYALAEILLLSAPELCTLVYYDGGDMDPGPSSVSGPEGGGAFQGSECAADEPPEEAAEGQSSAKKARTFCHEKFNRSLKSVQCQPAQVVPAFQELIDRYTGQFGVLSFIYSVILTKTVREIQEQVAEPMEALIDNIHGHGSQPIINLLLTGFACGNVFDGEKDLGGMKLYGIPKQAPIGLLSVLEHYRYLEVGWYLKNPCYPIWLLASETHLSVVFSEDESLISKESAAMTARRILRTFDSDGNGFILTGALPQALNALDIHHAQPDIESKLDSDGYGIVLVNDIIQEFYAADSQRDGDPNASPRGMTLYHYNGIKRSNSNNEVQYHEASAKTTDVLVGPSPDSSLIVKCLQTKWPSLEVTWKGQVPNMN